MFVSFEKTLEGAGEGGGGWVHTLTHTAGVHIISAQKTGTHFPSDTFSIWPACLHVCLPHIKGQSTLWNKCLIGSGSAPLTLDLAGTQTPHSRGEFPL